MQILDQNYANFEQWLKSLSPDEYAIAGDQCDCWLAKWFASQGHDIWGVFPQDINSTLCGNFDREVFLDNPEYEDEFDEKDRIDLEDWACKFGSELDWQYHEAFRTTHVNRDQALEVLENLNLKILV